MSAREFFTQIIYEITKVEILWSNSLSQLKLSRQMHSKNVTINWATPDIDSPRKCILGEHLANNFGQTLYKHLLLAQFMAIIKKI